MRDVVEQATGAPCMFLLGPCGDLGPKDGLVGDTTVADRNGRQLGYAALSAIEALTLPGTEMRYAGPVISGATLGTWRHEPLEEGRIAEISRVRTAQVDIELPFLDLPTPAWRMISRTTAGIPLTPRVPRKASLSTAVSRTT